MLINLNTYEDRKGKVYKKENNRKEERDRWKRKRKFICCGNLIIIFPNEKPLTSKITNCPSIPKRINIPTTIYLFILFYFISNVGR